VIVALIAAVIYFATIGRDQFCDLLDFFSEFISAIAGGYLEKWIRAHPRHRIFFAP
jgi:hypothetical protein